MPKKLVITDMSQSFDENTIISSNHKGPVSFDTLINDLKHVRIIYVGEHHTDPADHDIQLKILTALFKLHPNLIVGMEMFDYTYQPVLNQWSAGHIDQQEFLEKVQWYANWGFDFSLYGELLAFIKEHRIPLLGLNVPSWVPARIAVGGIDNLLPSDRQYLPKQINLSDPEHRDYVKKVFAHHDIPGRDNFDYFYAAQCVWEDAMAESIAAHIDDRVMIVFAGNGHLVNKFGIPDRAFTRTRLPFKTILPYPPNGQTTLKAADYIWIRPSYREHGGNGIL